jgi:hypothetical protein
MSQFVPREQDTKSQPTNTYNTVKVFDDSSVEYSPTDLNLNYAKNIVYQRENPNPLTIVFLVVGVLILLCFMYTVLIKRNISGIWFGNSKLAPSSIKYKISHNPFTDSLIVRNTSGDIVHGKLVGHTIWLFNEDKPETVGVLLNKYKIVWFNSDDIWHNVKILN